MSHMKEPWAIDPDDRPNMQWNNHIVSAENTDIAICFMAHDGTEENERGEANARRIVACVNACAGIPNDQLECDNIEFVRIFNERNTLNKQRDELLAACQGLMKAHRITAARPPQTVEQAEQQLDDIRNAVAAAEAAIASVKGGAS